MLEKNIAMAESPSVDLAAYVVAYRALGIDKEFALLCMAELARRRSLGDDFDFEKFIEDELSKVEKFTPVDYVGIVKSMMRGMK